MSLYPDCFPDNFEETLPQCAEYRKRKVYRGCINGEINRETFRSTHEENKGLKKPVTARERHPKMLSTSTYEDFEQMQYCLDTFLLNKNPDSFIIVGMTEPSCGPCALSADWRPVGKSNSSHVDWWIFKDAEPHLYFEKV